MPMAKYSDEYPAPKELTDFGLPASFFRDRWQLHFVPPYEAKEPHTPSAEEVTERFRQAHPGYLEEHYEYPAQTYIGEGLAYTRSAVVFNWTEQWRQLTYERLAKAFTFEELLRFWWGDRILSRVGDQIDRDPQFMLFRKIKSSLWRWGWRNDWNLYAKFYRDIISFDFALPGFETYIDFASWHNPFGYSQYARTYTDGAFCYNIVYQDKHILTIGWSATASGVLICQVQPTTKKGNRWMYKMPCHYFDWCLGRMRQNFKDHRFWIVIGDSMADHICDNYSADHPDPRLKKPGEETLARIRNLYNRELADFNRTRDHFSRNGMNFVRLVKKCKRGENGYYAQQTQARQKATPQGKGTPTAALLTNSPAVRPGPISGSLAAVPA